MAAPGVSPPGLRDPSLSRLALLPRPGSSRAPRFPSHSAGTNSAGSTPPPSSRPPLSLFPTSFEFAQPRSILPSARSIPRSAWRSTPSHSTFPTSSSPSPPSLSSPFSTSRTPSTPFPPATSSPTPCPSPPSSPTLSAIPAVSGESAPISSQEFGTDEEERQVTPQEHWQWGRDPSLKSHWHGRWRTWYPLDSKRFARGVKSVRSLMPLAPDYSRIAHKNDWYDEEGGPSPMASAGNYWEMDVESNSLPDGMFHPVVATSRRYCVSTGADGVWVPLTMRWPEGRALLELFFKRGRYNGLGSVLGFLPDGKFMASMNTEQARDSPDHPDPSWTGDFSALPDELPDELPELPKGTSGTRSKMTRFLQFSQKPSVLEDFYPADLTEEEKQDYMLVPMPENLVLFAPKSMPLVRGRPFALGGTWVLSGNEVKKLEAHYDAEGNFVYAVGEHYVRVA